MVVDDTESFSAVAQINLSDFFTDKLIIVIYEMFFLTPQVAIKARVH